jgi:antitoxin VapB
MFTVEIQEKLNFLRELIDKHALEAILLQRVSSIAWVTGGATVYVNSARSEGEASLLITQNKQFLFTNNIEAVRLEKEEGLASQGWDFQVVPWFEPNTYLQKEMSSLKVGSDVFLPHTLDLSKEISILRANLNPEEGMRFRTLGGLCSQAMDAATQFVRPNQTEYEIAALLDAETKRRGVQAIVNLIGTDERIFNFRHPIPTAKKLEHYAMLVLCGRRQGLVCSITRLIHFGHLPDEIQKKALAVARIDALMIAATRPGHTLGDVFKTAMDEYSHAGYPEEWSMHHQGGPAGYEPREYIAGPGATEKVSLGQVYAWNPSISGSKSEDTVLVSETGNEVLTSIPGWPVITIDVDGITMERPAILVMD